MAGLELADENLGVSTDAEGTQPIDQQNPVDFGPIPNFSDLRFLSPFYSQCVYFHNRSDQPDLGPPTDLIVSVQHTDETLLDMQLSLVGPAGCFELTPPDDIPPLSRQEVTVKPGDSVLARVRLDINISPGEGPFNFNIFVVGVSPIDVLGKDLRPTAMEVSQGIQNLANDMPLVVDRRTIVRVYVDNAAFGPFDIDISSVRARLYATRGGGGLSGSPINAKNNPITVKADGGDRRNLDDSFWFYLPSG